MSAGICKLLRAVTYFLATNGRETQVRIVNKRKGFRYENGQTERVDSSLDLQNWQPLSTNIVGPNRFFELFVPSGSAGETNILEAVAMSEQLHLTVQIPNLKRSSHSRPVAISILLCASLSLSAATVDFNSYV